jgi:hypothetical protein
MSPVVSSCVKNVVLVWTVHGLNPVRAQYIFVSLKIFRLALGPTILLARGKAIVT